MAGESFRPAVGGGGGGAPIMIAIDDDSMLGALVDTGGYTTAFEITGGDLSITYGATIQTSGIDGWADAVPYRDFDATAAGFIFGETDLFVDVDITGMTNDTLLVGLGVSLINDEATPQGAGAFVLAHTVANVRYGEQTSTTVAVRDSQPFDKFRIRFFGNDEGLNAHIQGRDEGTGVWKRLEEYFEQGSLLASSAQFNLRFASIRNGSSVSIDGRTDTYGLSYAIVPITQLT